MPNSAASLGMAMVLLTVTQALAQTPPPAPAEPAPTGIWERANLFGDPAGLRSKLADAGVTLTLIEQSEVLGNSSGGFKQGATYDGLTTLTVQVDTQKAWGWEGGTINLSALQIHGRNLSQYYLGNLQTVSGIEAQPTTRLWEAWVQQAFLDGKFDVKIGQQSIDQDFMVSANSLIFVNTAMGWPLLPSVDMYAGGPAYPLSSLGVRLRGNPMENVTVLGGVFQDNPPGGSFYGDTQFLGTSRWGANVNLRTGALFVGEAQYGLNLPSTDATAPKPTGLPTSVKIGFWYDTGRFPNQTTDTLGNALGAANSNGIAKQISGNYSAYALVDQGIWQPSADSAQLLSLFARVMTAPSDRNLVNASINAGVTLKAPFAGRDSDTLGLGAGYGAISHTTPATPHRTGETFIELTYQAQITPWLQIQPDAQYIIRPAGGVPNPYAPASLLKNEAVFGIRTNITF
jgi:porin